MNKKLVKNRVSRTNTLEAMTCKCSCSCSCYSDCGKCSGGGSFQVTEQRNLMNHIPATRSSEGSTSVRRQIS